jgi:protein gp37
MPNPPGREIEAAASTAWAKPAGGSKIEWTGPTLNCLAGCSPKSPGCRRCYAKGQVHRFASMHYVGKPGLVVMNEHKQHAGLTFLPRDRKTDKPLGLGAQWTGAIACLPHKLMDPLRRAKGTTWFSNSVSDIGYEPLFATDYGKRFVAAMFGLFTVCPAHLFQILTKRMDTLLLWFAWAEAEASRRGMSVPEMCVEELRHELLRAAAEAEKSMAKDWAKQLYAADLDVAARWSFAAGQTIEGRAGLRERERSAAEQRAIKHGCRELNAEWPRRNIHVGVSVEGRRWASRIDELRRAPAALRFLSIEPLIEDLGDVDLTGIDWAIWGGESGDGASVCEIDWLRSGVKLCRRDGVIPFVKQLGARPLLSGKPYPITDAKGGNMADWPADLRVREMPL